MKTTLKLTIALFIGTMLMGACQQVEEPVMEQDQTVAPATRAFGDKTPIVAIYVETNDVNPLNAGDYVLPNGKAYADIVEFFAANIRWQEGVDDDGNEIRDPVLYLNDKMTNLLENGGAATYVAGLQAKGIKVVLTILGDHTGIGFCNLDSLQSARFAKILAHAVSKYGLDGIGFDDEYADYDTELIQGSYGRLIKNLHAEMPANKLITLFQYGHIGSSQIGADAGVLLDYVYSDFSYYNATISVSGVEKTQYAPQASNLGSYKSPSEIITYGDYAYTAAENGYGAIMHFNLRTKSERNQTNLFSSIADGAWGEISVDIASTPSNAADRPQDWTFVPSGHYLTMADVNAQ